MRPKTWRVSNRVAASALTIALGAAAEAAVYSAVYDPPGTGTVPGFVGTALFNIADDCVESGNGWFQTSNNGSGDCGLAFMDSATVYLYSEIPSSYPLVPTPGNALGSFSFGPNAMEDVNGVLVIGGLLVAVDTGLMGPKQPDTGVYSGQNFWLQFVTECEFDSCFSTDLIAAFGPRPESTVPGAYIAQECVEEQCDFSNRANVVFTRIDQVPEPGTLALLLGALGLGWLTRRRTSPRSSAA